MMTLLMSWESTASAESSAFWRRGSLRPRRSRQLELRGCVLATRLSGIQAVMAAAVAAFSMAGTWLILKVVDARVGLRVSPEDESTGLDLSQHDARAYSINS